MFDIGWTELLVIAIVMIVVVGPKDLPPMLRAFGKMTGNLRKMAGDFRAQFEEALKETELDDVRKTITDAQQNLNPTNALRDAINPLRQMGQDIKNDLQKATQVPSPAPTTSLAAEPGHADPLSAAVDAEAQKAVEGTQVPPQTHEVAANAAVGDKVAHQSATTAAPLTAAPTTSVSSAPLTPIAPAAAHQPAPEQPVKQAAKPRRAAKPKAEMADAAVAAPVVEKAKRVRKATPSAEAGAEAPAVAKAKASRKPKVASADASVVDAASVETASETVPARKRAVKKIDTSKGDA
jgi:sec-independent protein translocase protein TatB